MDDAPKEILENACRHLRKEYGRPETEFARRILTEVSNNPLTNNGKCGNMEAGEL